MYGQAMMLKESEAPDGKASRGAADPATSFWLGLQPHRPLTSGGKQRHPRSRIEDLGGHAACNGCVEESFHCEMHWPCHCLPDYLLYTWRCKDNGTSKMYASAVDSLPATPRLALQRVGRRCAIKAQARRDPSRVSARVECRRVWHSVDHRTVQ